MALVRVEHLHVEAERLEHAHAAHAEEDLLLQPVLDVAAVEAVGDLAHVGFVVVDVGVEEVERCTADVRSPHLRVQGASGELDARPRMPSHKVSAIAYGSRFGYRSCCQPSWERLWRK